MISSSLPQPNNSHLTINGWKMKFPFGMASYFKELLFTLGISLPNWSVRFKSPMKYRIACKQLTGADTVADRVVTNEQANNFSLTH